MTNMQSDWTFNTSYGLCINLIEFLDLHCERYGCFLTQVEQ